MNADLGNVIASRTVRWIGQEAASGEVSILLGAPRHSDEFGGVLVPFQILGLGQERVKFAVGVDGIQGLLLALRMIRTDLEFLQRAFKGRLIWLDDETGSCGFVAPDEA